MKPISLLQNNNNPLTKQKSQQIKPLSNKRKQLKVKNLLQNEFEILQVEIRGLLMDPRIQKYASISFKVKLINWIWGDNGVQSKLCHLLYVPQTSY